MLNRRLCQCILGFLTSLRQSSATWQTRVYLELWWEIFQFEPSPVFVCTRKGFCSLPSRIFISREGFSVLASINELDARMHPMVVAKGKTRQSLESFQQLMVLRILSVHSWKKAYMTNAVAIRKQWFREFFAQSIS